MSEAASRLGGSPTDDGSVPPALGQALAARAAGQLDRAGLARIMVDQRLIVPLLEVDASQLPAGEDPCAGSDRAVAVVGLTDPQGGHVGLGFSGMAPLLAWNPRARPLPTPASDVARAVLGAGGRRLLIDPAGPHRVELVGLELLRLADCQPWPEPWADPYVLAAISAELAEEIAAGCAVRLEPPQSREEASARLVVVLRGEADVSQVAEKLAASAPLAAVLDSGLAVRRAAS